MFRYRIRRRLKRGLRRRHFCLLNKLQKVKKATGPLDKPVVVKTQLRDMIVLPEMVGSIVGVHNGKVFNQVRFVPSLSHSAFLVEFIIICHLYYCVDIFAHRI